MRVAWMIVLAASVTGACTGEPQGLVGEVSVRDSAGVEIREFSGTLPTTPASVEVLWEHGHGPEDYTFQSIFVAALRPDGSAVVGDLGNQEVISIPASGNRYSLLASSGQGPSEVRLPRAVRRFGLDSVWVQDVGNAKLLLFQGDTVAAIFSTQGDRTLTQELMPAGVAPDGALLMVTASYRPDFEQDWLDGHLVRFDPLRNSLDTVASYPMAPRTPQDAINPFAPYGAQAVAGGVFVHGRTDLPEFSWRTDDGVLTNVVRWEPVARYPTEASWDEFESWLRADLARVNPRMSVNRLQQFVNDQLARYELDPSAPLPLYGSITGAADGSVWIADFRPRGASSSAYTILGPDGVAWRVEFPQPFRLLDATDDLVLGVYKDEFDVEALAVYRYRR